MKVMRKKKREYDEEKIGEKKVFWYMLLFLVFFSPQFPVAYLFLTSSHSQLLASLFSPILLISVHL